MKKDKSDKFKMLKTFIILFKMLGWLCLVGGLAAAIEILVYPQMIDRLGLAAISQSAWLVALAMLIGGVIYAMILFALSECVQGFLSIEGNTRKLRDLLDRK
ncbi:MAG: hypothetical protein WC805_03870 [Patescibacteria group bacterium]|jgi:hypothetical protein